MITTGKRESQRWSRRGLAAWRPWFAAVFVAAFAVVGGASGAEAESRASVVTSCLSLYCWAANIAGTGARVANLLPPQADPHDYSFTPGDARRLNSAELVVVNGLGFEPWLDRWLGQEPSRNRAKLVTIADGLPPDPRHGGNPHLWLDPAMAAVGVSNIAAALQRVDPARAREYASNAVAYAARLRHLDEDIASALAGVTNRAIVTYHDAFPWFAARYRLEIAGVVEQVPDVNPTPKYLAQLSRTMRQRGIRAIYVPPNSASRLARQIAEDLGVELVPLDTIESGAVDAAAYEKRMRNNLAALRRTLR